MEVWGNGSSFCHEANPWQRVASVPYMNTTRWIVFVFRSFCPPLNHKTPHHCLNLKWNTPPSYISYQILKFDSVIDGKPLHLKNQVTVYIYIYIYILYYPVHSMNDTIRYTVWMIILFILILNVDKQWSKAVVNIFENLK